MNPFLTSLFYHKKWINFRGLGHVDLATIQSIRKRAEISIHKHRTKIVAVVGHHDCAGNSASDEDQKVHLLKAAQTIKTWDLSVESVVALWVCNDSDVHPLA